jgi:hypothetical protein
MKTVSPACAVRGLGIIFLLLMVNGCTPPASFEAGARLLICWQPTIGEDGTVTPVPCESRTFELR